MRMTPEQQKQFEGVLQYFEAVEISNASVDADDLKFLVDVANKLAVLAAGIAAKRGREKISAP